MATRLWVSRPDADMLRGIVPVELTEHLKDILTGEIGNDGLVAKIRKSFVIGRKRIWIPTSGQHFPFVRVDNHPMYPNGFVMTPYSAVDVDYHLGTRTIDKTTPLDRVELIGSDQNDFAARVFSTYFYPACVKKRPGEIENHFVLYEAEREREMESRQGD
jgi:hypothetical protein